eukprot:gene14387-16976_t
MLGAVAGGHIDLVRTANAAILEYILDDPSLLGLDRVKSMPEAFIVPDVELSDQDLLRLVIIYVAMKEVLRSANMVTAIMIMRQLHQRFPYIPIDYLSNNWNLSSAICAGNGEFLNLIAPWFGSEALQGADPSIFSKCKHGRVDMAQWIMDNFTTEHVQSFLAGCIENGYLEAVKWLYERNVRVSKGMTIALASGNMEVIRYIHEVAGQTMYEITHPISQYTIETLEYMLDRETPGVPYDIQQLQYNYYMDFSFNAKPGPRWISAYYRLGVPLTWQFMTFLIHNGTVTDLEDVKRSVSTEHLHDLLLDMVGLFAILHGTLEHFLWVEANSNQRQAIFASHDLLKRAIAFSKPNVLKWLVEKRIRLGREMDTDIYTVAIQHSPESLQVLVDVAPTNFEGLASAILTSAIRNASARSILFLHEQLQIQPDLWAEDHIEALYKQGSLSTLVHLFERYKVIPRRFTSYQGPRSQPIHGYLQSKVRSSDK